jgi:hypothetical protein
VQHSRKKNSRKKERKKERKKDKFFSQDFFSFLISLFIISLFFSKTNKFSHGIDTRHESVNENLGGGARKKRKLSICDVTKYRCVPLVGISITAVTWPRLANRFTGTKAEFDNENCRKKEGKKE